MSKKTSAIQLFTLLRTSINTIIANPIILYPLCITAFIQLLILEILYFAPRFPLSIFFGPIIRRIWGEAFMHYPFNLVLLPKLFYYAQVPIFILAGGFLSAVAVSLIAAINEEKRVVFKSALRKTAKLYVHIVIGSLVSFAVFSLFSNIYGLIIRRASLIRSETGIFFLIKQAVISATPYASLFIGILATTIFIFVIPVIVIEKKKIFFALFQNFKILFKSFWLMLGIVLIPTILYIPVLWLRGNISSITGKTFPGIQLVIIILSVIVTLAIDATVLTATTTVYLIKKENQ